MTPKEAIEKAIRHFKCVRDDAQVVLDSGFGTHEGESDLVYRNRKMYAELAIAALEKQTPKKLINTCQYVSGCCPNCKKYISDWLEYNKFMCCPYCGQKLDLSNEE